MAQAVSDPSHHFTAPLPADEAVRFDLAAGHARIACLPPDVLDGLHERLQQPDICLYYPSGGRRQLLETILSTSGGYSALPQSVDAVLVTAGAINGLDLILRSHLNPGDRVLLPTPGFGPYRALIKGYRGVPLEYRMLKDGNRFTPDFDYIGAQLRAGARFVIVNSPHNPTGSVLSLGEVTRLGEMLEAHREALYISDEVYSKIVFDGVAAQSMAQLSDRGFVLNSISKAYGAAGFRLGWIVARPQLLHPCKRALEVSQGCVSSLAQEASLLLMAHGTPLLDQIALARSIALEVVSECELGYATPEGTFYLALECPSWTQSKSKLAELGVRVAGPETFGQEQWPFCRITYAIPKEELVEGLRLACGVLAANR